MAVRSWNLGSVCFVNGNKSIPGYLIDLSYILLKRDIKNHTRGAQERLNLDKMLPIVVGATPSSVAMASAFVAAAGAYLNAKLGISTDLTNLYHDRDFGKRLAQCVNDLGESQTVYGLLERGVEFHGKGASEALWFEGKTWTYAQLKDRKDTSNAR